METQGKNGKASTTDLRIVEFRARNVLGLQTVAITPGPDGVVLGGKNRQGKSSTLNAILATLGGALAEPSSKMIREGESEAGTFLDLGDVEIHKEWRESRNPKLVVKAKDGRNLSRPQSTLDAFFGAVGADLADLLAKSGKPLAETVAKAYGLDEPLRELAKKREAVSEQRRDANRERDRLKAKLESLPEVPPDAPDEEVDPQQYVRRYEEAQKVVRENDAKRRELQEQANEEARVQKELEAERWRHIAETDRLRRLLREAEERGKAFETEAKQKLERAEHAASLARTDLSQLEDPNLDEIAREMESVHDRNAAARAKRERAALDAEFRKAALLARELDDAIKESDRRRSNLLASTNVDGLSIGENGISINGTPFEGLSTAERIDFGIQVLIRANPRLKIIVIRDGAFLDDESLELAKRKILDAGYQPWIERVGRGAECDVIIEAGEVSEVRGREEVAG